MDDEVEEHHRSRDKISLDPDASSSDDDEFDDGAGVMDIEASDESDEDEDDEEDDSEDEDDDDDDDDMKAGDLSGDGDEEAALIKAMRAQQRRLDAKGATRRTADDDDLEESDTNSDDETKGIRGSKKDDFYGDDDVDHEGLSDEDERKDEEREARRLQRAAADTMDTGDFDAFSESSESESEEEKTLGAKAKAVANKGKKTKGSKGGKTEGASVESLGKEAVTNAASDAVASDAPELIALTKELTKNLDEIKESVEPVIKAARRGELATAEGISYLDAKHLLMLSYCVNIVFYLLLKSEGRSVKDHPVVLRLVEIRAYLEKLRPIDRKLKYQVDKLLKMAEGKQSSNEGNDSDDDPTKFKPNPEALVGKNDDDDGDKQGAYRPPKMVATTMDEFEEGGKSSRQKRKEQEARRRASRSALIKVRLFVLSGFWFFWDCATFRLHTFLNPSCHSTSSFSAHFRR